MMKKFCLGFALPGAATAPYEMTALSDLAPCAGKVYVRPSEAIPGLATANLFEDTFALHREWKMNVDRLYLNHTQRWNLGKDLNTYRQRCLGLQRHSSGGLLSLVIGRIRRRRDPAHSNAVGSESTSLWNCQCRRESTANDDHSSVHFWGDLACCICVSIGFVSYDQASCRPGDLGDEEFC
jgi:hypothetical protein